MIELIYLLVTTHFTILSVTLYLHRSQAHKGIDFHPIISHAMRFWLWLTTGMVTKEWVAVHRLHHRHCDKANDPHSPHVYGILNVLFKGAWLYNNAAKDTQMVEQYSAGTVNDWIEKNLYSKYSLHGIIALLIINTLLFQGWGILIWLIQMAWIPFWAAGVVNGLGHWFGYRNGQTKDFSRNIFPLDFIVGGELLHNNHHLAPANPKFKVKWYELDIGWIYCVVLCKLRLATLR